MDQAYAVSIGCNFLATLATWMQLLARNSRQIRDGQHQELLKYVPLVVIETAIKAVLLSGLEYLPLHPQSVLVYRKVT